jgi:hypothetical protein
MSVTQSYTLKDFRSPPWFTSLYKDIPISKYSEKTRKLIRNVVGQPVRFKFRGPRPAKYGRSATTRQSGCLKEDAVTFTVYTRQ